MKQFSLGVTAAKRALEHADTDDISTVYTASVSEPFIERGLAGQLASALGGLGDVRVGDFQGSSRATTNAILAGSDAVAAGRGPAVIVATDILDATEGSKAARTAGAGAGALVLEQDGHVATLVESHANTTGFVGSFTRADNTTVQGHDRFNQQRYLEAVSGALNGLDTSPTRLALPAPDSGWGQKALQSADIDATVDSTFDRVGWVGTASSLLDLGRVFEHTAAKKPVALASYGPGGCDALVFNTGESVVEPPAMTTTDWLESRESVTYAKSRQYRRRARGGD